eukprot:scaffold5736_cov78-Skeletonema_dohrnii-CCMP3373.AAC.1
MNTEHLLIKSGAGGPVGLLPCGCTYFGLHCCRTSVSDMYEIHVKLQSSRFYLSAAGHGIQQLLQQNGCVSVEDYLRWKKGKNDA